MHVLETSATCPGIDQLLRGCLPPPSTAAGRSKGSGATVVLLACLQAVVKGAKKQKVAPEDFNTLPAEQWPVRPYLEKYVAPLLMQAMQARQRSRVSVSARVRIRVRARLCFASRAGPGRPAGYHDKLQQQSVYWPATQCTLNARYSYQAAPLRLPV